MTSDDIYTSKKECEHTFVFLRTVANGKWSSSEGRTVVIIQQDFFFCEKCLHEEIKEKRWSGHVADIPNWAQNIPY